MRVALLWTKLSGYMNASLRAMSAAGIELFVYHEAPSTQAPYADSTFGWISNRHAWSGRPNLDDLGEKLSAFKPDLFLVAWHIPEYQRMCRDYRGRAVRVACLDNQWRGTLRQYIGKYTAAFHLHRAYDAACVAGERQALWARQMGFGEDRIWRGLYPCDVEAFSSATARGSKSSPSFLFVGRLVREKGIRELQRAYQSYRNSVANPWPLVLAGTGPEREIESAPGVIARGFVQPDSLPDLMADSSCFVMPSLYEPWCVAIHEACTAGLPVICTSECGASVHLVQDGFNGYVIAPGSVAQLESAMRRMSAIPAEQRAEMGARSSMLASQFTPSRFASMVLSRGNELREQLCGSQIAARTDSPQMQEVQR